MNRDILKGRWMQMKGKARHQWGRLTHDDLDRIQGDSEMLVGRLQEVYGRTREQIEGELDRTIKRWRESRRRQKAA